MPDKEIVRKALECIAEDRQKSCTGCEYSIFGLYPFCVHGIARDALELLKEQEAVVRCKDCIYATMTADGQMCKYCEIDTDDFGNPREVYHHADWFCAEGKLRG